MMTQISKNKQSRTRGGAKRRAPAAAARASGAISPRQAAARPGPVDQLLNPELFRALSDPTRLSLVACLAKCGRRCSVGEVAECCSVDFSVVSRHLAILEKAGALTAEKEGRTVYYSMRYAQFAQTLRQLADAVENCCIAGNPAAKAGCSGGACG